MQNKPKRKKISKCMICKITKNLLIHLYLVIFARPSMQKINFLIMQLSFRGAGYNNCCDEKTTGEIKFLNLLSKFNPSICIDIGANKGFYSKLLLTYTNSNVIAFEPLPNAFQKLVALTPPPIHCC